MDHERPISPWQEWRIIEKIGEGSFGKVFKAERTEQGHSFYSAIKIIPIPANHSEYNSIRMETNDEHSTREYFKNIVDECIQEICTMEYFRGNSHVVSVEDFKVIEYLDEVGWDIYIRMEYLDSFLDYCAGRELMERDVIKIGIDLCRALEYCQKLRIIHRDIKPENIFVSRFGDFKLGDFGIARELEKSMGSMSKKGTYSYMAPEMYQGKAYDTGVDLYSLGLVLYKLMNKNRLPFMDLGKQLITYRDKEMSLARRMNGENLPPPADASRELSEIILKACAFDPKDRYPDPEMMREDLERLRRGDYSVRHEYFPEEQSQPDPGQDEEEEEFEKDWADAPDIFRLLRSGKALMTLLVLLFSILAVHSISLQDESVPEEAQSHLMAILENNERHTAQIDDFSTAIQNIREQATVIVGELPECIELGREGDRLFYYDEAGDLLKVLIYPEVSETGLYEEYYYWEEKLFFVYLWDEETEELFYYNSKEELIRWIDTHGQTHDMDYQDAGFLENEEQYLRVAREQALLGQEMQTYAEENAGGQAETESQNQENDGQEEFE